MGWQVEATNLRPLADEAAARLIHAFGRSDLVKIPRGHVPAASPRA
jgi:hypothetical protein